MKYEEKHLVIITEEFEPLKKIGDYYIFLGKKTKVYTIENFRKTFKKIKRKKIRNFNPPQQSFR